MENVNYYSNYKTDLVDIYIKNNSMLNGEVSVPMDTLYITISNDVHFILNYLGVSLSKLGYTYWKEAVLFFMCSGKMHIKICSEVYPFIANKYGKTVSSVERAMRQCLENSLYFINKNDNKFLKDSFDGFLLNPHSSQILVKFVQIISSKEFQKLKQNMLDSFNN